MIIAFNVRPVSQAAELAQREGVDIRYYAVIYQAIEDVEAALKGILKPEFGEDRFGTAEIRANRASPPQRRSGRRVASTQ